MNAPTIELHYRRLPDRTEIFQQLLLEQREEVAVTLLEAATVGRPLRIGNRIVLEPGAPIVWFTYPDAWYDIGRFHLGDGTFSGYYANVLTPIIRDGNRWETTDLCLDVWVSDDAPPILLDEEEFFAAVDAGWIDRPTATIALATARRLVEAARLGSFPPPHVHEWPLSRVRAALS